MKRVLSILMILVICMFASTSLAMTAGTYDAIAKGFGGDISLSVTVDENAITEITVVSANETDGIGAAALPLLIDATIANQTIGIDSISGATVTSTAYKAAMLDALTAAGADIKALTAAPAATEKASEEITVDVVVAGAGVAGMTAGLKAAQEGNTVLVLEKTGVYGGASAMAGSGTIATGSKWQKEDGYEDSPEKLVEDMMANGHGKNDRATVELFANTIGSAFDWLVSEDGAAIPYQRSGSPVRNYSAEGRGAGVCANLAKALDTLGYPVMTSTRATELIIEDDAVVGIKAESTDKIYTIHAKAVILATGGYGANDTLVPDEYKRFVYAGHSAAEGDAIVMVEPLNAELINMDMINTQPNSMIRPNGLGQYTNPGVGKAYAAGAYMINEKGVRFADETASAWPLMEAMKQNEAQYLIMDQAAFDGFNAGMTGSKIYSMDDVTEWLNDSYAGQPVMKTAKTIEELAEKLGVPADAAVASAKAYNEAAASGQPDEYGRNIKAAQNEKGPFYALQLHIRYYASLGGLHINDNMAVLNIRGEAIPGLYAAGEVVGGVEGDVYMPATLFGWAVASGYNAGCVVSSMLSK